MSDTSSVRANNLALIGRDKRGGDIEGVMDMVRDRDFLDGSACGEFDRWDLGSEKGGSCGVTSFRS